MLRKFFSVFFSILSLVLLLSLFGNKAQNLQAQQSDSEVRPFTDLTLEITTTKDSLLPLQPIPIVIKLSNKTSQPILGYNSIRFGLVPLYLYARKSGETEKTPIVPVTAIRTLTDYRGVKIAAGETREWKDWLTLRLNEYFAKPGNYQLQLVLVSPDGSQRIESNMLDIEILEPTEINREVHNLIKNNSTPEDLFSGVDFNKAKSTLEIIATKFPNSGYSKSANFLLGEIGFHRKQYPQALGRLMKLEHDKDFIFAEKVKKYIDEIRESQKPKEDEQ